jgi:hypothetical protein
MRIVCYIELVAGSRSVLLVASEKEHPSQKANKTKAHGGGGGISCSNSWPRCRPRAWWWRGCQWLKLLPEVPPARAVVVVVVAAVAALLPKLPPAEARA